MGVIVDVSRKGSVLPKSLFGYEVLDFIGEGAGSQIFVVSDPNTRQLYALKHVVRRTEKDERFVEQLQAEFEVGRAVRHHGLRKSIDLKVNRTMLRKVTDAALVMELFDGVPIENDPPRRVLDALDCFVQTGKALEALHKTGYVHCDLKPNNILISNTGEVKVIDLGQACKLSTVKSRIQGTPDYIAPEQVKCEAVTPKTDVYNLGATMYWVLTGKHIPTLYTIKRGENSFLVDAAVQTPKDLNPRCPETLSNIIMDCVKVIPGKRPEMSDLIRRLEVIQYAMQRGSNAPAARLAAV
jgi:serine/threonine-protein kinase